MEEPIPYTELPFKSALSFEPLILFWKERLEAANIAERLLAEKVLEQWNEATELHGEIEDRSVLAKHESLVELLLTAVVAPASEESELLAVSPPFDMVPIKSSQGFIDMLSWATQDTQFFNNMNQEELFNKKLLNACSYILQDHYDIHLPVEQDFTFSIREPETGLNRYFQIVFSKRFSVSVCDGALPKLTDNDIEALKQNINDIDFWLKKIPLKRFRFTGIIALRFVETTDQEVLSALKNDLLSKDAVVSKTKIKSLEQGIRDFLKMPNLQIGVGSSSGKMNNSSYMLRRLWNGLVPQEAMVKICDQLNGSIYETAALTGQMVVVEDLKKTKMPSIIEEALMEQGIRSLIIAPVFNEKELVGMLELGCVTPGSLNPIKAAKVKELMPLFSVAMSRSVEEMENEVQAVIKSNYTAIHPTVEWRFEEAALKRLDQMSEEENPPVERIIFPEVYPLYGLTDIRGSSVQRNSAIQKDLIEHLKLIKKVMQSIRQKKHLPILEEVSYRVSKHNAHLKQGLNSGDEVVVLDFIHNEVEPMLNHLKSSNTELATAINGYFKKLDPELGTIYRHRKAYEDSITLINDTVSAYIDEEEAAAQEMFPHYFEKYKTDGVDYNMYVGASLVPDHKFDPIYLRNFRLWQLMMMVGVSRLTHGLMERLPVPLRTTELILAYHSPLSIRFRLDEKKFDVDGAYNMRYEIVKKRIDKAYIKNTEERVTQPSKIAIIYNQGAEAQEYLKFIEYLTEMQYLKEGVEQLELEPLQGVTGLMALRVEVNFETQGQDNKGLGDILNLIEEAG